MCHVKNIYIYIFDHLENEWWIIWCAYIQHGRCFYYILLWTWSHQVANWTRPIQGHHWLLPPRLKSRGLPSDLQDLIHTICDFACLKVNLSENFNKAWCAIWNHKPNLKSGVPACSKSRTRVPVSLLGTKGIAVPLGLFSSSSTSWAQSMI